MGTIERVIQRKGNAMTGGNLLFLALLGAILSGHCSIPPPLYKQSQSAHASCQFSGIMPSSRRDSMKRCDLLKPDESILGSPFLFPGLLCLKGRMGIRGDTFRNDDMKGKGESERFASLLLCQGLLRLRGGKIDRRKKDDLLTMPAINIETMQPLHKEHRGKYAGKAITLRILFGSRIVIC